MEIKAVLSMCLIFHQKSGSVCLQTLQSDYFNRKNYFTERKSI